MESEARRAARKSDLFGHERFDRSQPVEEHSHGLGEHVTEHPSDCAYCPICATIAVVRKTRPEVLDHLATAARELIAAAGIILEEAGEIVGGMPKEAASEDEPEASADGKVHRIHPR